MQIAIIDYGMGNLKNVQKAFLALDSLAIITSDKSLLSAATHIVLPGVGAFQDAMRQLNETGLAEVIKEHIAKKKPFLGVCLGMQLLFEKSYENGEHVGLGILPGNIVKLQGSFKVPHMGWNTLEIIKPNPIFEGIREESYVYFVHSYYLETDEDIVSSYTTYGKRIAASVQRDKVFAMQFHPEKSGDVGMNMLKNFINS